MSGDRFERVVPARFMMYARALALLIDYVDKYKAAYQDEIGQEPGISFVPFDITARQPLRMPDAGVDTVGLSSMELAEIDTLSQGTLDNHHFLLVSMHLYQDGSPYVIEGDELDTAYLSPSLYHVILAPEFPPRAHSGRAFF